MKQGDWDKKAQFVKNFKLISILFGLKQMGSLRIRLHISIVQNTDLEQQNN